MNLEHTGATRLFNYILYNKPSDYPDHYVLRKTFCVRGKTVEWLSHPDDIIIERDVRIIHNMMKRNGFYWLIRKPDDDPVIMGVYL